jgi:hypothetical protein
MIGHSKHKMGRSCIALGPRMYLMRYFMMLSDCQRDSQNYTNLLACAPNMWRVNQLLLATVGFANNNIVSVNSGGII